jgi:hypothetical protein
VQVNSPTLVLNKAHVITGVPQIRQFDWVVAYVQVINPSQSFVSLEQASKMIFLISEIKRQPSMDLRGELLLQICDSPYHAIY